MKTKLEAFVCGLLFALTMFIAFAPTKPADAANGESANTSTGVSTGYKLDRQTALFRSAVSGADSTTIDTTFMSGTHFGVNGRENVPVSARFSTAGANCVVRWAAIAQTPDTGTNFLCGLSPPVTLTASSFVDGTGKYIAPTYVFDSYGASDGMLIIVSISAGSVSFAVGSY